MSERRLEETNFRRRKLREDLEAHADLTETQEYRNLKSRVQRLRQNGTVEEWKAQYFVIEKLCLRVDGFAASRSESERGEAIEEVERKLEEQELQDLLEKEKRHSRPSNPHADAVSAWGF